MPPQSNNDVVPIEATLLGNVLEQRVIDLFSEEESLPVTLTKDDGNVEVRTKFEGQHLVALSKVKVVDKILPSVFREYLENFNESFAKADPMVKEVRHLKFDDANKREGVKVFLQFPFPISDRVMVHWKYLKLDRNNEDDHMMIVSEENNQTLLEGHLSQEERDQYILARTFLCAFWIKAVKDDEGTVVGSSIRYCYSGDVGGSMPAKLQQWIAPQNAVDSMKSMIKYCQTSVANK